MICCVQCYVSRKEERRSQTQEPTSRLAAQPPHGIVPSNLFKTMRVRIAKLTEATVVGHDSSELTLLAKHTLQCPQSSSTGMPHEESIYNQQPGTSLVLQCRNPRSIASEELPGLHLTAKEHTQ